MINDSYKVEENNDVFSKEYEMIFASIEILTFTFDIVNSMTFVYTFYSH